MRALIHLSLWVFTVSVFVHFLWEMLQSFAYDMEGVPLFRVVLNHLWASLGDGVLMLMMYGALSLRRRDPRWIAAMRPADWAWIVALGLASSVAIELRALATGRWSYSSAMPLVPGLDIGLLPVLQLLLLPVPIFWAAARLAGAAARRD
jgi:hypothetical protein